MTLAIDLRHFVQQALDVISDERLFVSIVLMNSLVIGREITKNNGTERHRFQSEKICMFPQLIRRVFQRFSTLKLFALFITFFVSVV